jgi:hypothetical protein
MEAARGLCSLIAYRSIWVGGEGPPVVLIQPLENIRPFDLSPTGKVIK